MFPMITTLEEMHRVRAMVRRARQDLLNAGQEFGPVSIGMMVEVPAAAVSIDSILRAVDFVSIGSNDLIRVGDDIWFPFDDWRYHWEPAPEVY